MSLSRWLVTLGCLCWLAIPARADPTVQDFNNPGVAGTNYAEYGSGTGFVQSLGPPGAANFYRLTLAGRGSTNNVIAFDLTAPGPTSHITGGFDFRIGGTAGTHADGIGIAFLPTAVYGTTGNGPSITEEASTSAGDGSFGFGLDTFNNGAPGDIGNTQLSGTVAASELSLNRTLTHGYYVYNIDMWGAYGYNLHQDSVDDTATPFDHCRFTVDIDPNGGGATAAVYITSNQPDATGGKEFLVIQGVIPGVVPFEMRVGLGGRTGGANDGHDIANIKIDFRP